LKVHLQARHQKDGSVLWSVDNDGFVLCWIPEEHGRAFCVESLPSNRTEDWYAHSRFESKETALDAFKAFCVQDVNQYLNLRGEA
jgi:hypothetical protein